MKNKKALSEKKEGVPKAKSLTREELEKKAVKGAKKVLKEYGHLFERLAEYDRTGKS